MLVVWAGTIHLIIKWGNKIDPSKFIDSKMPPEHSIINSLSDDDWRAVCWESAKVVNGASHDDDGRSCEKAGLVAVPSSLYSSCGKNKEHPSSIPLKSSSSFFFDANAVIFQTLTDTWLHGASFPTFIHHFKKKVRKKGKNKQEKMKWLSFYYCAHCAGLPRCGHLVGVLFPFFFLLWKLFFFMSEIISEFYCFSHLHKTRSTLEKVEEIKNWNPLTVSSAWTRRWII